MEFENILDNIQIVDSHGFLSIYNNSVNKMYINVNNSTKKEVVLYLLTDLLKYLHSHSQWLIILLFLFYIFHNQT